jgi:hypothetical protein
MRFIGGAVADREDGLSEVILQLLMTIKERISSIRKSATLQNLECLGGKSYRGS